MLAQQTLPKPLNWQDLETLSKMLFGEIWEDPDIQKNGRNGQQQYGVDIVSMPKGINGYYGIQCKGKEPYNHQPLTKAEIDAIVTEALHFPTPLLKFYLVTTASKDAVIEAYVREKNLAHRQRGLFGVHLYAWEDMVDLICRNPKTHDWYVNHQQFVTKQSVLLTFADGSDSMLCRPKFEKVENGPKPSIVFNGQRIYEPKYFNYCVNYGFCPLQVKVTNTGSAALLDYNIHLLFKGNCIRISKSNTSGGLLAYDEKKPSNIIQFPGGNAIKLHPINSILVPGDVFLSDLFYISDHPHEKQITMEWKVLSRTYSQSGTLLINVEPLLVQKDEQLLMEHPMPEDIAAEGLEEYCEGR